MTFIDTSAVHRFRETLSASADIVTRESERYEASLKRWSAAAEKPAGIIVYPTSAEDVAKAIQFSIAQGLELAVVGGGHGTSGASSTDGGLVIDLSEMRVVTVNEKSKTITAQGGALWADVDNEAATYGLSAVGGTVNHTGVGGLTLGGGYGYLTPAHGLVIDNLLEVEAVLADGTIVTASEKEEPDLFWAAKGAGIGFGVFTKFTYQAHEQGPVWGGMLVFPREKLDALIRFANELIVNESGKTLMLIGFVAPPPAHQPVLLTIVFYNGTEEEAKKFYEPVLSLEPFVNDTAVLPYPKVNELLNGPMSHGIRRTMKGSAFLAPLDTKFAESVFDDYVEFITKVPDAIFSAVLWEFVPFRKILEVSQTATAFANRGAYGNLAFGPGWTKSENDAPCREWTRAMSTKTRAELERRIARGTDAVTKDSVGEYGNYDSLGATGKEVFGVNFPRLAELKKKYDPNNVFAKGPSLVV
ncbi:putative FAD linked oxidase domain protein [Diplocarpon rosae]|nr:putative FAD linked oxidase domain protein [Diplocarpon rosae]